MESKQFLISLIICQTILMSGEEKARAISMWKMTIFLNWCILFFECEYLITKWRLITSIFFRPLEMRTWKCYNVFLLSLFFSSFPLFYSNNTIRVHKMLLSWTLWRQEYRAQDNLLQRNIVSLWKEFGNGPTATDPYIWSTQ